MEVGRLYVSFGDEFDLERKASLQRRRHLMSRQFISSDTSGNTCLADKREGNTRVETSRYGSEIELYNIPEDGIRSQCGSPNEGKNTLSKGFR